MQWMDDLSTKTHKNNRKMNIALYLKPTGKDEETGKDKSYRFRLLNFTDPEMNDRKDAFIERYVHQHWGKTEKGFAVVDDEVTCLLTEHVGYKGNVQKDCPMCRHAGEVFNTLKNSGYKDKIASDKNRKMSRVYQAIFPVYVVNDPNNEKNNGTLKAIIFSGSQKQIKEAKEYFTNLCNLIKATRRTGTRVFNSREAVDLFIKVGEEQVTPTYKKRVITQMVFGKTPYTLKDENSQEIDLTSMLKNFPFDENYYTSSTVEEIDAFYHKYFGHSTVNAPEEDIDDIDGVQTQKVDVKIPENVSAKTDIPEEDIDLSTDAEDLPPPETSKKIVDDVVPQAEDTKISQSEYNDMLSDIDNM